MPRPNKSLHVTFDPRTTFSAGKSGVASKAPVLSCCAIGLKNLEGAPESWSILTS